MEIDLTKNYTACLPYTVPYTYTVPLTYPTFTEQTIRDIVRDELAKHDEEDTPPLTIEVTLDGKHYRGEVYAVEEEE